MRKTKRMYGCRSCGADAPKVFDLPMLCKKHRAEYESREAERRAAVYAETAAVVARLMADPEVQKLPRIEAKAPASWKTR